MWVGWFLGIEDPIGVRYIGFEEGGLRFGEVLGAGWGQKSENQATRARVLLAKSPV